MIKVKVPSAFMKSVILNRFKEGSYVNGDWIDGGSTSSQIRASVQPVPSSQYRLLPEGDSPAKFRQIYTNIELQMPSEKIKPDEITDGSKRYRLTDFDNWSGNGHTAGLFREIEK